VTAGLVPVRLSVQQIRFTPPREISPPPAGLTDSAEFKSEQRITLAKSGGGGVTPIALGRPRSAAAATAQTPPPAPASRPRRRAHAAAPAMSAEAAARARAQIGSEVLQWHARRLSQRSISFDETSSPSATSEPQSPTGSVLDSPEPWGNYCLQNVEHQNSTSAQQQQQQPQPQPQGVMTSSTVLVFKSPTSQQQQQQYDA